MSCRTGRSSNFAPGSPSLLAGPAPARQQSLLVCPLRPPWLCCGVGGERRQHRQHRLPVYSQPTGRTYLDGTPQQNLRNRVSSVYTDQGSRTHYSYDVHGNVAWVAQDIPGFPQTNYVKYDYELVSGNVNQVDYNEGRGDQFHQRYVYDVDNALTEVQTSRDGTIWESDARYPRD